MYHLSQTLLPRHLWDEDNPDPSLHDLLCRYHEVDNALLRGDVVLVELAKKFTPLTVAEEELAELLFQDRTRYLEELGVICKVWVPILVIL